MEPEKSFWFIKGLLESFGRCHEKGCSMYSIQQNNITFYLFYDYKE